MGPISSGHKNFNNVKNQCYKKHSMYQFYASSDCRLSFVPSCWIFVYVCSSLHRDGQDPESGACDPQSLLYKQSAWHYDMHGKYKKLNYRVKVALQRVGNLRRLRFRISWKRSAWFQKMKACSEGGLQHYAKQSEGRNGDWPCFSTWHCGFNTLWATGSD